MKIVKKGKPVRERMATAALKFTSRVVCDACKSTLEFTANDLKSYCVPGKFKVICPVCTLIVEIAQDGLPQDIVGYCALVFNGHMPPVEIGM